MHYIKKICIECFMWISKTLTLNKDSLPSLVNVFEYMGKPKKFMEVFFMCNSNCGCNSSCGGNSLFGGDCTWIIILVVLFVLFGCGGCGSSSICNSGCNGGCNAGGHSGCGCDTGCGC